MVKNTECKGKKVQNIKVIKILSYTLHIRVYGSAKLVLEWVVGQFIGMVPNPTEEFEWNLQKQSLLYMHRNPKTDLESKVGNKLAIYIHTSCNYQLRNRIQRSESTKYKYIILKLKSKKVNCIDLRQVDNILQGWKCHQE